MAISFVNFALGASNSTTSFSITLPATQDGDIIILEYTHRGTGDATLGGTYSGGGFTEKHDQQYATSTFSGKTLWARATGDHTGQTVTGTGLTNSCAAIITIYRGALASGDPIADATIVGEQNASGNETQAEITTVTNAAWVVLVVANAPDVDVSSQTCTSPGSLTERAERLSTGGLDTSISHASASKATAGATGAFTWAQSNGAGGSWAYAIKPAAEPSLTQLAFRGRNDDHDEVNATWKAANNTNFTQDTDANFRIRFEVEEVNTADISPTFQLEYNLNSAGWNAVNASSSVVRSVASPHLANAAATTNLVDTSARAFQAGEYDEVDGLLAAISNLNNESTNIEYCIQIRSADVADSDTIQLRVSNAGVALTTYTQTPTITVNEVIDGTSAATPGTPTNYNSSSSSTTHTLSHTPSGNSRVLIVTVSTRNGPCTGVVFNTSEAMTKITSGANGGLDVSIWRLINPTATTANIVATLNSSGAAKICAITYTNANQDSPIRSFAWRNHGFTTTPQITTTSVATTDICQDAICGPDNTGTTPVADGGQTEKFVSNVSGDTRGASSTEGGASTVTMGWTVTNENWVHVIISIRSALVFTGVMAGTLQRATFSGIGNMAPSGVIASTLQRALASLSAIHGQTGIIASILRATTFAGIGTQTITGILAGMLRAALFNGSGSQSHIGAVASTMQPATFNGSGISGTLYTGEMHSTMQMATFTGLGNMAPTGIMAATLQAMLMSASGTQNQEGLIQSTIQTMVATFEGIHAEYLTGVIQSVLQASTFSGTGFIPNTGIMAATLQPIQFIAMLVMMGIPIELAAHYSSYINLDSSTKSDIINLAQRAADIIMSGSSESNITKEAETEQISWP